MRILARTGDQTVVMLRDKVFRVVSAQLIAGIGVQLEFEEVSDVKSLITQEMWDDLKQHCASLYEDLDKKDSTIAQLEERVKELKNQSTIQRDTLPLWNM